MTLARISNSSFPSFPSLIDRFFEGNFTDWNNSNFAGEGKNNIKVLTSDLNKNPDQLKENILVYKYVNNI